VIRRVMRPETARAVTAALEGSLEEGGTGMRARIDGFRVAGKTGTAQKIEEGTGRYSARGRVASFIGFVPADAPRVVVLALLDEPQTSSYGGVVAAPLFRAIAAGALERLGVTAPPPPGWQEAQLGAPPVSVHMEASAVPPIGMPSFLGLSLREALERARELGWTVRVSGRGYVEQQTPAPGAAAAPGKAVRLSLAPVRDAL
jgi:cell division protein FtsI (penicillin-binding protein 3)